MEVMSRIRVIRPLKKQPSSCFFYALRQLLLPGHEASLFSRPAYSSPLSRLRRSRIPAIHKTRGV